MAWPDIIAATVSLSVPVGGGFGWLWKQWKDFRAEIHAELADCRADRQLSDERRGKLIVVIELLWRAVERHAPEAPELHRGKQIMEEYKVIGKEPA